MESMFVCSVWMVWSNIPYNMLLSNVLYSTQCITVIFSVCFRRSMETVKEINRWHYGKLKWSFPRKKLVKIEAGCWNWRRKNNALFVGRLYFSRTLEVIKFSKGSFITLVLMLFQSFIFQCHSQLRFLTLFVYISSLSVHPPTLNWLDLRTFPKNRFYFTKKKYYEFHNDPSQYHTTVIPLILNGIQINTEEQFHVIFNGD